MVSSSKQLFITSNLKTKTYHPPPYFHIYTIIAVFEILELRDLRAIRKEKKMEVASLFFKTATLNA